MKEYPILMNGPMVRATLDGRKTQTRRVMKSQPPAECSIHYMLGNESWLGEADRTPLRYHSEAWGGPLYKNRPEGHLAGTHSAKCPYGAPGDQLWVRENFYEQHSVGTEIVLGEEVPSDKTTVSYAADATILDGWRLRPSIHMPRWAGRILLENMAVRVEHLHDISTEDIIAEGLTTTLREYDAEVDLRDQWRALWESTGGDWDANPKLWVIDFKQVLP